MLASFPDAGDDGQNLCLRAVADIERHRDSKFMQDRESLLKACLTLASGPEKVALALNSAQSEGDSSFALSGKESLRHKLLDFIQQKIFSGNNDLESLINKAPGWGIGASIAAGFVGGIEAIVFDTPLNPNREKLIALYFFDGIQVGSPWSVYGVRTFGCKNPSSYEGGFVSAPFVNLGIDWVQSPTQIAKRFPRALSREIPLLTKRLEEMVQLDSIENLQADATDAGAALLNNSVSLYSAIVLTNLLAKIENLPPVPSTAIFMNSFSKNWVRIFDIIAKHPGKISITEALIKVLRKAIAGQEAEFPMMSALVESVAASYARCDSISIGLPNAVALTWFLKLAEFTPSEFKILMSGEGFKEKFGSLNIERIVNAFAFLTNPEKTLKASADHRKK
jgi:hypothetical protein